MSGKTLFCAFCGKTQQEVKQLVKGENAECICNACVDIAYELCHAKDAADIEYNSWFREVAA